MVALEHAVPFLVFESVLHPSCLLLISMHAHRARAGIALTAKIARAVNMR